MVIYGYLMTTRRSIRRTSRGRMARSGGITLDPDSLFEGFVYLALQELATLTRTATPAPRSVIPSASR